MSHAAYVDNLMAIQKAAAKRLGADALTLEKALRQASRHIEHEAHCGSGPCVGCHIEETAAEALLRFEGTRKDYNTAMVAELARA